MGEKIRDLNSISIGNAQLMIELNEVYTKEEGRVIHVQNPHFRYLIDESGFVELAATILRAKDELYYFKDNNKGSASKQNNHEICREYTKTQSEIISLLEGVDFRVIEKTSSLLSIIVNPSDANNIARFVSAASRFKKLLHPYGKEYGYTFLYQMHQFELYQYQNDYVEVYYELPAYSLTPKVWMPLDKKIQARVWTDAKTELDDTIFYIYKLAYAFFFEHCFTEKTIQYLKSMRFVLKDEAFSDLLKTVFFKYSDRLLEKLQNEEFDELIKDYYTFLDY